MADNRLMEPMYGYYPHLNPKRAMPQRNVAADAAALTNFGLSVAPGSGEALSAVDAWNASGRAGNALLSGDYGQAVGEYGNMLTGVLGAIPGAGVVARGTKRGAQWMNENLPAGMNKLLDGMMPDDPRNTLNIFAGPTAKTADQSALARAEELAASGASREDIWSQTGWFQGADGKWRFEIDDSKAFYDPDALSELRSLASDEGRAFDPMKDTSFLGGVVDHRPLFEAYPGASDVPVHFLPKSRLGDAKGAYSSSLDRLTLSDELSDKEALSYVLHEAQHAVQKREGFSGGTGLKEGRDAYSRNAGEVEARNVQKRRFMTPEQRRAKAPWITQDIPFEDQIVRQR